MLVTLREDTYLGTRDSVQDISESTASLLISAGLADAGDRRNRERDAERQRTAVETVMETR